MAPLFLVVAALSVGDSTAGAACKETRRLLQPTGRQQQDFCIQQSTSLQPTSLQVFANGSCLLLGLCTSGSGSIALYRRLRPGSQHLLLRCTTCDPLQLLTKEPASPVHLTLHEVGHSATPYKSPLVAYEARVFSHIHLLLFNASGEVQVNLTFAKDRTADIVDVAAWFTKTRLTAAYPWKLSDLKARKFITFTPQYSGARFYLKTVNGNCDEMGAILRISVSTACVWYNQNVPFVYLWALDAERRFRDVYRAAAEFQLQGTYDEVDNDVAARYAKFRSVS